METLLDLIRRQLTRIFGNWQTTVLGIAAILSGVVVVLRILAGQADADLLIPTVQGIVLGIAALFSQDAKPIEPPNVPPRGM